MVRLLKHMEHKRKWLIFSNTFSWIKIFEFRLKFHFRVQLTITMGLDNGLAPNRQQAIIWSNGGLFHWCVYYASLGLSELNWNLQSSSHFVQVPMWYATGVLRKSNPGSLYVFRCLYIIMYIPVIMYFVIKKCDNNLFRSWILHFIKSGNIKKRWVNAREM